MKPGQERRAIGLLEEFHSALLNGFEGPDERWDHAEGRLRRLLKELGGDD